jgi:UDP-N-acetylmuramyl tripeptide synthase
MKLLDSRRLTGPNLLLDGAGAVIDVDPEDENPDLIVERWQHHLGRLLEALDWSGAELAFRRHRGGLTMAFAAPVDALYAATEVNEWALSAAEAELEGSRIPKMESAAVRLRLEIERERSPALMALREASAARNLCFLSDDDEVSVGLGTGGQTWRVDSLPDPSQIDWGQLHDVPVALVTGTNGKTTTVRLLAAIVEAAGLTAGLSSTDWIRVGTEIIDTGDYSGPGGGRQVLRDTRVEVAVLETARGGILRRGLAVERADVALVTNIAADHLGESGVYDLDELARAKLVVHKAAERLVLNADDAMLVKYGGGLDRPVTWCSQDADNEVMVRHRADGGHACWIKDGALYFDDGANTTRVTGLDTIPIALGGAARHNVANAMGATGVALALGLGVEAIRTGLEKFRSTPEENPGRLNLFELGDATVVVDFAHNPHGMEALLGMAAAMPARRRLVTTGQAGDRDDDSILQLARTIAAAKPDRVVVKELTEYLRGRAEGEVATMIVQELERAGLAPEAIDRADSEMSSVRQALAWCEPGDLLLLITHSKRSGVVSYLSRLVEKGWLPGQPIPGQSL